MVQTAIPCGEGKVTNGNLAGAANSNELGFL